MVGFGLRRAGLGVVLTATLFCSNVRLAAGAPAAEVSPVLQGDALLRAPGSEEFAPVGDGSHLAAGNGLRAPAGRAAALKPAEGVSVRLAPDSTLTLRQSAWLPAEQPGAAPLRAFQVSLASGELDLEVHDPTNTLGVLVSLPGGRSLALWRGSANVSIRDDRVAIALYEGTAIAGSASRWKPLTAGTGAVLAANAEPSSRPTPTRPDWVDGAAAPAPPFALVRGDERAALGVAWRAIAGASRYRVEMAPDARMVGAVTTLDEDSPTMKTEPMGAGTYFVRVRALSSSGVAGPTSTVKALRVARLTVPPMAFASPEGAIVLPASAAVTLDDTRDLEVATISEFDPKAPPRWSPASKDLTLAGAPRRTLRIRHVPSQIESPLVLARRELRAQVSFSPMNARWPENPIDVTVKVEDESGYLDPSREPIKVDVRVDLDRLDLAWKHTGDTWTARVMPKSAPGPWVVRVDVRDQAGTPIGASLLDVDGPRVDKARYRSSDSTALDVGR
jgi:hypothetical protein